MTCRPKALDPHPPGPFRPLVPPRRVVVAKRKHNDTEDRWRWEGDLVGTAGHGWRVVRHVRASDARVGADDEELLPDSTVTFRWLGKRAPATVLVKLDDALQIIEVKVDAALPVPIVDGRFTFVDLDVDVVRDAAGDVVVRDWDLFEERAEVFGYTDASRAVARAGEAFGLRLLAAWEPTLEADVAAILAATETRAPAAGEPRPTRLRRAGRLDLAKGASILWSVAEGSRGRRWRSLRRDGAGRVVSDLLLELDPAGRWTRLELATAGGILTLHPEAGDSAVHGNVVAAKGVRHLGLEWGSDHRLVVAGDPVAAAALAPGSPPGPGPGLLVTAHPGVEPRADLVAPGAGSDALPGPSWPLEVGEGTAAPELPG